ncbi:uncharacterized protein LOC111372612 [Olea europaea var. sylvestris]|uniref:uncharacterized protein LOC111372612 n=1 Tax=Olea europaea var. sylvestris TaxID=158386 RepID=UPI000C1D5EC2|nr:uncharacterized protein LOC111372612 [Olea europaea var. sylvestris]
MFTQKKDDNSEHKIKGKARVFIMTQKDAEDNSNAIAGILLISDTPAYVLFDSRAIHSFVSTSFISKSSINCGNSKSTLEVSIPLRQNIEHRLYRSYKPEKMLRKEISQGFLVSIFGEKSTIVKIEDVQVVQEFINMFPEELPGIPPSRQVKFTIHLVLGAASVSKALYRMAPKELQELKIQLQEL